MHGWESRLVEDVRRHRRAYVALFWASLALTVVALTLVVGGVAAAGEVAAPAVDAPRLAWGIPLVLFPVGYASVVGRLLDEARR